MDDPRGTGGEGTDITPLTSIDGPVDKRALDLFLAFGQSTSRRGFLARCGRVILGALGVTAVAMLPIDEIVQDVAALSCGDYQLCGIYGRVCTCCNGGNPLNYCPAGTKWYSYWSSCCQQPFPPYNRQRYYYWDCCSGSANCGSCLACYNNSVQPAWCNGVAGAYRCTAVVAGAYC
jgi:hypothetical protein